MFFLLSKTAGYLVEPHFLALTLLAVALALRLLGRTPRLRRGLVIGGLVYLWLMATGGVANLLLYPLETRHARPASLSEPAAIIVLTGMTDHYRKSPSYELTEAADRFVEGVRLAHAHPRALLVISGGSAEILDDSYREADVLARLARGLGIGEARLRVDRQSRNTHENAVESARLLRGVRGPVVLVTSAYHMPRSVACFTKVGLAVVPWPADFLRTGSGPGAWLPRPYTLVRSTAALHEYLGWLSYRIAGYV
jgi:uncharacterized SAM-binding protein YcdF (DUF218 family)